MSVEARAAALELADEVLRAFHGDACARVGAFIIWSSRRRGLLRDIMKINALAFALAALAGRRAKCPPNFPNMCANENACADGKDYCCEQDCSSYGSKRRVFGQTWLC